ncbi:hypothetical protein J1605_007174 [Eschrichtius robustus]|uniref:CSD domain-containing protein n=1 Tax=Eschrichtius robustus TaxID=9764 RepID=A0AB34H2B1_ESCRO|nr:hypothetical protein J1605_007174 [Eschrichtius robustus]
MPQLAPVAITTSVSIQAEAQPGDTMGSSGPGGFTSAAPACRDKKPITVKVLGTVKWFSVRNGCDFINRNNTKEDVFVYQSALKKNNSRKHLCRVRDGETWSLMLLKGEKGVEAANVPGPGGVLVPGSKYAADVTMIDTVHIIGVLYTINSRMTRIMRMEKE